MWLSNTQKKDIIVFIELTTYGHGVQVNKGDSITFKNADLAMFLQDETRITS